MKQFEARSFSDIIEKLGMISRVADEMSHHPDFEVKNYKEITFYLFTHDTNSITKADHKLAQEIDAIFG